PLVENAAHVLARDAGHSSDVALAYLLTYDDATTTDIVAEGFGQPQQRPCDPALQRQERSCDHGKIGVAQPSCKDGDDMAVDIGVLLCERLEAALADEAQHAVPE